jgi:hypothetical protein
VKPRNQAWQSRLTCAVTAQLAMERLKERLAGQESCELPRKEFSDLGRRRLDLLLDGGATIDDGNDVLDVVTEKVTLAAIGEGLKLGG